MKGKKLLTAIIASAMISLAPIPSSLAVQEVISTDEVGIVYNLTEREVLQQLRGLAEKGSNEDGWYYIPETGELVDHGKLTAPMQYTIDLSVLINKDPRPKEVINYHIHPLNASSIPRDFPDEVFNELKGLQPPSTEDIATWYDESKFLKFYDIQVKEFRVVEFGCYWSVDIEKSLKAIEKDTFYMQYQSAVNNHIISYIQNYWQNKKDGVEQCIQDWLIESFVQKAKELGLHIEYHEL